MGLPPGSRPILSKSSPGTSVSSRPNSTPTFPAAPSRPRGSIRALLPVDLAELVDADLEAARSKLTEQLELIGDAMRTGHYPFCSLHLRILRPSALRDRTPRARRWRRSCDTFTTPQPMEIGERNGPMWMRLTMKFSSGVYLNPAFCNADLTPQKLPRNHRRIR